jgi:PAS domain S-box-containing protein
VKAAPTVRLRIATKINALTGLCAVIALTGAWLLLARMQATMEAHERSLISLTHEMDLARRMQVDLKKQVQEWKDVLLRGHEPADLETYRAQFLRQEQLVREDGQALSGQLDLPGTRGLVAGFLRAHTDLGLRYRNALDLFVRSGGSDYRSADRLVRGADRTPTDMIDTIVDSIARVFDSRKALYAVALEHERRDIALVLGTLLMVLLAAGMMVARRLVRSIHNLTWAVSRVSAEKDYSLRVVRCSDDEVGLLTDGFNEMLREIQTQTAGLQRSRQELAELTDFLENATERLHWLDADGRILWVNRGELRASGFEREEFVGHHISEFHVDPQVAQNMLNRMRSGETLYNYEARLKCKNGSIVDLLICTNPVVEDGKLIQTRCFCRSITERKRVENELRRLNTELEIRVVERTRQLEETHRQLRDAAHEAGMAEVATNVLHNVGNVLNSVNVSAEVVAERARTSEAAGLLRVVAVLREHEHDLATFITADSKGQHLLTYMSNLAEHLQAERAQMILEIGSLQANIEHIKDIVTMQQRYAKLSGASEIVSVVDLVEDSLRLNAGALVQHRVEVIRDFRDRPVVNLDKHKVLQILVNLIRNAKYACEESQCPERRVTLRVAVEDEWVRISVIDNGVGIAAETVSRLFTHGFTTRASGHGFGLHGGALAAKELGGSLRAHSDGLGRGATFTLDLPVHSMESVSELEAAHA